MKLRKYILTIAISIVAFSLYSQVDSLESRTIYAWTLNSYDLSIEMSEIDTSLASFQNFNPLLVNTISSNYLGNLGSASQSKIYYDRSRFNTEFLFSQPYGIYFHLPQNQIYYNTKRQYTLLKYSNAGPKNESEQLLKVLHTQNVNSNLNIGIDYDLLTSDGRYLNQQVRQNKITLFSSYQGNRYSIHSNLNLNRIKAQENGGIDSIQYVNDDGYSNRKNMPVKLDDAKSEVLNTGIYLAQEYRFGKTIEEIEVIEKDTPQLVAHQDKKLNENPNAYKKDPSQRKKQIMYDSERDTVQTEMLDSLGKLELDKETKSVKKFKVSGFSLSHELTYNSDVRKFSDDKLLESSYDDLDIYIDSSETSDDVRQKQLGNKLSLNYKYQDKFSSRLSFYNEQMTYIYNILPDTSFMNRDTIVKTNMEGSNSNSSVSAYIKAKLFNQIYFRGYSEYYISGYKRENSKIDFKFAYYIYTNNELSFEGKYSNERPDYFYENYSSNHFQWDNQSLRKIEEWDAGFAFRNTKYKFEAKVRYGQITNHLYLDSTAYVAQYHGQINILTGELYKRLKVGPINSVTRFVYQKSTNDSILSIPELNLYQSLYFEHLTNFKSTGGQLLWQVGMDYRYASKYMADGYMPASGLFYRQFNHEQPDYHCFDVFINFSIKRARFYLKYNYLNVVINKNYHFTGPYYPAPDPIFKFGLAWTFYD